jgi:hypothetical protein
MGRNDVAKYELSSFKAPFNQRFNLNLDQNGQHDGRCNRCIVLSGACAFFVIKIANPWSCTRESWDRQDTTSLGRV